MSDEIEAGAVSEVAEVTPGGVAVTIEIGIMTRGDEEALVVVDLVPVPRLDTVTQAIVLPSAAAVGIPTCLAEAQPRGVAGDRTIDVMTDDRDLGQDLVLPTRAHPARGARAPTAVVLTTVPQVLLDGADPLQETPEKDPDHHDQYHIVAVVAPLPQSLHLRPPSVAGIPHPGADRETGVGTPGRRQHPPPVITHATRAPQDEIRKGEKIDEAVVFPPAPQGAGSVDGQ